MARAADGANKLGEWEAQGVGGTNGKDPNCCELLCSRYIVVSHEFAKGELS